MTRFEQKELQGYIGLGLALLLWLLSTWRLAVHAFVPIRDDDGSEDDAVGGRTEQQQQQQPHPNLTQWFTRRRAFHSLLWVATACQALAYADISGLISIHENQIFAEKLGYVLLDVAGRAILEMLAFSTVTALWVKATIDSSPTVFWGEHRVPFGVLPILFLVLILVLVLVSAALAVVALVEYRNEPLSFVEAHPWGRAQIMLEAIAWGSHASVVFECMMLNSRRVLSRVPTAEWSRRLSVWSRAVLPMVLALLVYTIRCLWLLAIFRRTESLERGTWVWWLGFAWVPTWLAIGALLYSARERDSNLWDDITEPLLLPARPPAEAFMAFSRNHNGDGESAGAFTFCQKPITYVSRNHSDTEEGNSPGSEGNYEGQD